MQLEAQLLFAQLQRRYLSYPRGMRSADRGLEPYTPRMPTLHRLMISLLCFATQIGCVLQRIRMDGELPISRGQLCAYV